MSDPATAITPSAPTTSAPNVPAWPQRLFPTGRILATIGAVGFAIFAWTYFVRVSDATYVLNLNPGDVDVQFTGGFAWAFLSILGLFLLPFVWLRAPRWLAITGAALLLLTGCATAILTLTAPSALFATGASLSLVDGLVPHSVTAIQETKTLTGFILAAISAVLTALGALFVLLAQSMHPSRSATAAARNTATIPGAGFLTLGLIIFLIGALGMGWTAVNCDAHPLFFGQCNGLTFTGVLHYGISTNTDAFDPIASLYAIPALLVGGAALVFIGLWLWKRLSPGLSLWLTLYLAAATFFFIVAYAGTNAIALHSADLGLQSGAWNAQSGLWVAALGLLISWLALIPLWLRALRPAT